MRSIQLRVIQILSFVSIMVIAAGCMRVNVHTPESITCHVPPFNQQSEVQHELQVVDLRQGMNSAGDELNEDEELRNRHAEFLVNYASKVAREGGGNDFACKVTVKNLEIRKEKVPDTASACLKEGKICGPEDFFDALNVGPPGVKVVNEIQWCGAFATGRIFGCSPSGGHSMVVVSECNGNDCPKLEAIGWLHELGHLQGLPDRHLNDPRPYVMKGTIEARNTRLTECDCMHLRKYRHPQTASRGGREGS